MEQTTFHVDSFWDTDAAVWVATSPDVPGLATEAETIEALSHKLRTIIPELLRLNHVIADDYAGTVVFQLTTQKQEIIEVAS
jgi:predicted RNase H-like HicB family nuclease